MSDAAPRSGGWRAALVLLGSALVLLSGLQALEPRFFLRDDYATHFLPAYEYAYETLAWQGEIPLLDQHQMFGGTFLASGQTGVFLYALYPARALLGLFGADPVWLVDLLATLHFLLAGLGMFLLLRFLGLRPGLAIPLALCWCFLPFAIIAARSWIFVSYLAAYLPFQQWLLQRWLASPSLRGWLQLAGIKVLFLFTGYIHYVILAFFFEGCFLLAYFLLAGGERGARMRQAVALGGAYLLAGMLAAPLLLYATLAGKYHVHGYDPLSAKINAEIGFPAETNGALVVRAEEWARLAPSLPRYLLVDEASRLLPLLAATTGLRQIAAGGHYLLFENARAIPIVSRLEGGEGLPFRWRTNGLELDLPADFPGGHLLFNVAGLPEYRGYRNGESLGAPALLHQRPLLELPPGAGHVELRYVDGGFRLGLGLAALGLLSVLLLLRRGRGRREEPAG